MKQLRKAKVALFFPYYEKFVEITLFSSRFLTVTETKVFVWGSFKYCYSGIDLIILVYTNYNCPKYEINMQFSEFIYLTNKLRLFLSLKTSQFYTFILNFTVYFKFIFY